MSFWQSASTSIQGPSACTVINWCTSRLNQCGRSRGGRKKNALFSIERESCDGGCDHCSYVRLTRSWESVMGMRGILSARLATNSNRIIHKANRSLARTPNLQKSFLSPPSHSSTPAQPTRELSGRKQRSASRAAYPQSTPPSYSRGYCRLSSHHSEKIRLRNGEQCIA